MFQNSAFDAPKKRIKNQSTEPAWEQINHLISIHLFTSKRFQKFIENTDQNESDSSLELEGKITTF